MEEGVGIVNKPGGRIAHFRVTSRKWKGKRKVKEGEERVRRAVEVLLSATVQEEERGGGGD